jgi:PTH2 family peptidyl-tRNA hydrolase
MMETKQAILVREDLKMSKGKAAAQVAHGSVSCALKTMKKKKKIFDDWITFGQKKVVLGVKDLKTLKEFADLAKSNNILCEMIRDMGLTELKPGTITVLAIGPDREDKIDKVTGKLSLLK